jgi:hypothetical protein
LLAIAHLAATDAESLHHAPHQTPVSRPDDALAARKPVLTWDMERES